MRCADCHLCVSDKGYYDDDFDLICLVTNDYVDDEKGCTRTNKWLKQQSKDKWVKIRQEEELRRAEDFIKWCEEQDKLPRCSTCEYFTGAGDWNLCCTNPPPCDNWCGFLCYEDTKACDNYKKKETSK